MKMRTPKLLLLLAIAVTLTAQQPMKINLRITKTDGQQRKADTKFRLTMTTAASIMLKDGIYYLNGSAPGRAAWKSTSNLEMYDYEQNFKMCEDCINGEYPNPCGFTPDRFPAQWDWRCGDASGMFFIRKDTSDGRWSYNREAAPAPCVPSAFPPYDCISQGTLSAGVATISPEPARGEWPYQWTPATTGTDGAAGDYPNTGIPGLQQTVDGLKVRQATTSGRVPDENPAVCDTRLSAFNPSAYDDSHCAQYCHPIHWNPTFLPGGTANPNVIYYGGRWYMAFTEEYNNPKPTGPPGKAPYNGWMAGETWRIRWATSTDGQHWTIEPRYLFRYSDALEHEEPYRGLFVTQLFIDQNYFYMLLNAEHDWMMLLRAPIVPSSASGYGPWQIATGGGAHYVWKELLDEGTLDVDGTERADGTHHIGTLNESYVMSGVIGRRAAIGRIAVSPSRPDRYSYVGLSVACRRCAPVPIQEMVLWSAPDLDTPFVMEQQGIAFDGEFEPHPNGLELQLTNNDSDPLRTESMSGTEFDLWMNGRSGTAQNDTVHWFNEYRVTATLSGGIYSPRARLRSFSGCSNGCDVFAGPDPLTVSTGTYGGSTFTIVNDDGQALATGGLVSLQTPPGTFVSALNGGGSSVVADRWHAAEWEKFTVVKMGGTGTSITFNDDVAFRCLNGKYLTTQSGGGIVDCTGSTITDRQTFRLIKPAQVHHLARLETVQFDAAGGTGAIDVEEDAGVTWTAVSNDPFITITSGWSGSGNGSASYVVAPNYGASRSGTISVDGGTVTVIQAAATLPDAPTGFAALGRQGGVALLSWQTAAGASSYEVWRRSPGSDWSQIATTGATWYEDGAAQGLTCLYEARSVNSAGVSGFSNYDLATNVSFSDDPAGATTVKAVHISELRSVVDSVRALAALAPGTYSDPGVTAVRAVHITDLRTQLAAALIALALPVPDFTDPATAAGVVRREHINELRAAVR